MEKFRFKKEEVNLSNEEILDIICIVDINPGEMDKVFPDNIDDIISRGTEKLREERAESNKKEDYQSYDSLFDIYEDLFSSRFSENHAIHCSVNRAEDLRLLRHVFEDKISESREGKDLLFDFINRQIKMNDLSTELFQADIIRRVSLSKNNNRYLEEVGERIKKIIPKIISSIDKFEEVNQEALMDREDIKEVVDHLRENLLNVSPDEIYEKICKPYSQLVFSDFEDINEPKIEEIIKGLDRS